MDSYRVEKGAVRKILLPDEDAEIDPGQTAAGGHRPEPEMDRLSNIVRAFNELFGDIAWEDGDRVRDLIICRFGWMRLRAQEFTILGRGHRHVEPH